MFYLQIRGLQRCFCQANNIHPKTNGLFVLYKVQTWVLKLVSLLFPLQIRYPNRPIVEFEIAAGEQMKITELRLAKLFSTKTKASSTGDQYSEAISKKAEGKLSSFSNSDFLLLI